MCSAAWCGPLCTIQSCPGAGDACTVNPADPSLRNGICNEGTQTCQCNPGWGGVGCDVPDCPGTPDCNGRGQCDGATYMPAPSPVCRSCVKGWVGQSCERACASGTQTPVDSGNCVCDACFSGPQCDIECAPV